MHAPPMHIAPPVHVTPHPPQFVGLRVTSTQPLAQDIVPMGHVVLHAPALHTWPAAHVVPHAPQCFASVAVATQTPPHNVWFAGQAH